MADVGGLLGGPGAGWLPAIVCAHTKSAPAGVREGRLVPYANAGPGVYSLAPACCSWSRYDFATEKDTSNPRRTGGR
jgi:hypothetical protein